MVDVLFAFQQALEVTTCSWSGNGELSIQQNEWVLMIAFILCWLCPFVCYYKNPQPKVIKESCSLFSPEDNAWSLDYVDTISRLFFFKVILFSCILPLQGCRIRKTFIKKYEACRVSKNTWKVKNWKICITSLGQCWNNLLFNDPMKPWLHSCYSAVRLLSCIKPPD